MFDQALLKLQGIRKTILLLASMALIQGALIVMQGFILARVVTNLFHGEKLSKQLLPIVLFVLFFIGKQVVIAIRDYFMQAYSVSIGRRIRKQLNEKLFQLGPNLTATEGTGNLVTLAIEGITQMEGYIKLFLPKVLNMVMIPIIIWGVTFYYDSRSALVLLLVLPTLLFFMVILGYAARLKAEKQFATYQTLSNHFVDSLRGLETLKYLGLSKRYDRNIRDVSERYRKSTMGTLSFAFLSTFALEFFSSLSVAIVALFLGLGLINGEIVLFPALFILILAPDYFAPLREFGTDYHATLNGKNAFQAIQQVIQLPIPTEQQVAISNWHEHSELVISDLSVTHANSGMSSLAHVNFQWKGYGKIGIVGASGAGKSTLINVLTGFMKPTSAKIHINDVTIQSFHQQDWLRQMLYIPQKPYIFNDTLEKNIAFYTPHATKEEIEQAAKLAGLTEVITELPNGLQEKIGEGGRPMSGGQEQRIALARAFLDDSRQILLFDEPTAHLDIETEWEIKQQMLPLFDNKLVFFATHRLHWINEMGVVVVLENGQIVEIGKPHELLQAKGAYYKFVQAQLHGNEVAM